MQGATRIRSIQKYGNSHVIKLSKIDMIDLVLSEGDFVDISDLIKVKNDHTIELQYVKDIFNKKELDKFKDINGKEAGESVYG